MDEQELHDRLAERRAPAKRTTPPAPSNLSKFEFEFERGLPPNGLPEIVNGMDWENADRLAAQHAAAVEKAERDRAAAELKQAADRLWQERGSRYQTCYLANYKVTTKEQHIVHQNICRYGVDMRRYVDEGMGIVLLGPKGTGKDHLIAGLMHMGVDAGLKIKWVSGHGLFRRGRDAIDSGGDEASLLRSYTTPDILAISDPSWERIPLTDWQRGRLGEIVDERWNNRRPIWITVNADNSADAERLLGPALVDRLRDGALSLACNWSSYRQSIKELEADDDQ